MFTKAKRKQIEEHLFKFIGSISDEFNLALYKARFAEMTDLEFTEFMNDLDSKKINLALIQPTGVKNTVTVEKNMKVAKEMGVVVIDNIIYKTKNPYMVNVPTAILRLPVKRTVQILSSKIGVPKDNKTIDTSTGQATGASKGSRITLPELQLLDAMGLDKSLVELMKIRGGDLGAYRAYSASLENYGEASQEVINQYGTGVVSGKTLRSIHNAMLLDINTTDD